eukprot:TRINITY_DN2986_c1_g1_i4.p1 TRINITY_DN2986_c1_g1~~TRINITY_DN2986_c1_g1_i4.p1  ORF type:complete len:318 (+),score=-21.64 TRINITY_DN2986_c1_g1_i4:238-1191(+)
MTASSCELPCATSMSSASADLTPRCHTASAGAGAAHSRTGGKRKYIVLESCDSTDRLRSEKQQCAHDVPRDADVSSSSFDAETDAAERCNSSYRLFVPRSRDDSAAASSPAPRLEDFFVVDDDDVIGCGQFGVVRRCVHRATGVAFACKTMRKPPRGDAYGRDKLRREVALMRRVAGHPGVVQLRGAFEDDRCVHLVMDLCEGGELYDVIAQRGCLTEEEAALVLWQVASGVAFCHARGVLHRDLKPENILLHMTTGTGAPPAPAPTAAAGSPPSNSEGRRDSSRCAWRISGWRSDWRTTRRPLGPPGRPSTWRRRC